MQTEPTDPQVYAYMTTPISQAENGRRVDSLPNKLLKITLAFL